MLNSIFLFSISFCSAVMVGCCISFPLFPAVVVFSAAYSEASASSVASEMSSTLTSLSTRSLKVFITELFPEPYGPVTAILRISSFAIAFSKSFTVLKESSESFNTIGVNAFCFHVLLSAIMLISIF